MSKRVPIILGVILCAAFPIAFTGCRKAQEESMPSVTGKGSLAADYHQFNRWGIAFDYPKAFAECAPDRLSLVRESFSWVLYQYIEEGRPVCGESSLGEPTFLETGDHTAMLCVGRRHFTEEPRSTRVLRERSLVLMDLMKVNEVSAIRRLEGVSVAGHDAVVEEVERSNGGRGACLHVLAGKTVYIVSWIVNDKGKFEDWEKEFTHLVSTVKLPPQQEDSQASTGEGTETVEAKPSGTSVILMKGQGLYITAICGRGCDPPTGPCDVFLLTAEQYAHYTQKQGSGSDLVIMDFDLDPKGRTPLMLSQLSPGVYRVGVKIRIDESVVKSSSGGVPYAATCREFFADDLSERMDFVMWTAKEPETSGPAKGLYQTYSGLIKWYKMSVESHRLTQVVALFLDRNGSFQDWEQYYPKEEQFQVTAAREEQEQFWEALGTAEGGVQTTPEQREKLLALLKRGGRACLPNVDSPTVFWIDGQGQLQVRRKVPNSVPAGVELQLSTGAKAKE